MKILVASAVIGSVSAFAGEIERRSGWSYTDIPAYNWQTGGMTTVGGQIEASTDYTAMIPDYSGYATAYSADYGAKYTAKYANYVDDIVAQYVDGDYSSYGVDYAADIVEEATGNALKYAALGSKYGGKYGDQYMKYAAGIVEDYGNVDAIISKYDSYVQEKIALGMAVGTKYAEEYGAGAYDEYINAGANGLQIAEDAQKDASKVVKDALKAAKKWNPLA